MIEKEVRSPFATQGGLLEVVMINAREGEPRNLTTQLTVVLSPVLCLGQALSTRGAEAARDPRGARYHPRGPARGQVRKT